MKKIQYRTVHTSKLYLRGGNISADGEVYKLTPTARKMLAECADCSVPAYGWLIGARGKNVDLQIFEGTLEGVVESGGANAKDVSLLQ